jgi:hypothetical protein
MAREAATERDDLKGQLDYVAEYEVEKVQRAKVRATLTDYMQEGQALLARAAIEGDVGLPMALNFWADRVKAGLGAIDPSYPVLFAADNGLPAPKVGAKSISEPEAANLRSGLRRLEGFLAHWR